VKAKDVKGESGRRREKQRAKMLLRADAQGKKPGRGEREFESGLAKLGLPYRTQRVIGQWIVDFAVPCLNLVIEVDGPDHLEKVDKDQRRQRAIEKMGWAVARVASSYAKEHPFRAAVTVVSEFMGHERWGRFIRARETDLKALRDELPVAPPQETKKWLSKPGTWERKKPKKLRETVASRRIERHHRAMQAQGIVPLIRRRTEPDNTNALRPTAL